MTPEIEAFKKQLNNNPLTNTYLNQVFSRLDPETTRIINEAIQLAIGRYTPYLEFMADEDAPTDPNVLLKSILEKQPFFIFSISHLLNENATHQELARKLLIAGVLSILYRTEEMDAPTHFLFKSLDDSADLQTLNDTVFASGEDQPVLTKQLYVDLVSFAKNQFKFTQTKNLLELIEIQFCFQAIAQIFLRYFFQLMELANHDTVSQHRDAVFTKIFALVRFEEIRYWKNYKDHSSLQSKLQHIVQLNAHSKRHPQLRKEIFTKILEYHPLVHDGSKRQISAGANELLKKQLHFFQNMSVVQINLLINIIQKWKGDGYAVYLLMRLIRMDKEKYIQLQEHLEQSTDETEKPRARLAASVAQRFAASQAANKSNTSSRGGGINLTPGSKRELEAKKKLKKIEGQEGMISKDDVTQYLKDWLQRLYKRVKKEGALTYDQLSQYLAQFAEEAQPVMSQISEARQEELVESFNTSADEMLDDFSNKGNLTEEQAERIKSEIHKKAEVLKEAIPVEASPTVEAPAAEPEKEASTVEAPAEGSEKEEPAVEAPVEEPDEEDPVIDASGEESKEVAQEEKPKDYEQILKTEKLTIGFDEKSPIMTLVDFFTLPLGDRKGPDEDNWFEYHKRYIKLAVEKDVIKSAVLDVLDDIVLQLPKLKYKKYFNIFPTEDLEETTLFAVHDMWATQALKNLRA